MMTRVRVTYVAMVPDGDYPIMTAHTFKDIRAGLDEYYGVSPDNSDAKFLSFEPHITKYPSEYEGDFVYSITDVTDNTQYIERVKVYCTEFHPHTIYEVNNETE